jgi:hypothetical protein
MAQDKEENKQCKYNNLVNIIYNRRLKEDLWRALGDSAPITINNE